MIPNDLIKYGNTTDTIDVKLMRQQEQIAKLTKEREELKASLDRSHADDWTASLIDRLNELVRENLKWFSEVNTGRDASNLIREIHGRFNELRTRAETAEAKCEKLYEESSGVVSDKIDPSVNVQWMRCSAKHLALGELTDQLAVTAKQLDEEQLNRIGCERAMEELRRCCKLDTSKIDLREVKLHIDGIVKERDELKAQLKGWEANATYSINMGVALKTEQLQKERDQLAAKCETFYEIIKNYGSQNVQYLQPSNEHGSVFAKAQEAVRESVHGLSQKETEGCNSGEGERSRVEKEKGGELAQEKGGQPGAIHSIRKEIHCPAPGEISEGPREGIPNQATLQSNSQECGCQRRGNSSEGVSGMRELRSNSCPSRRLQQAVNRAVAMSYLSCEEAQEILTPTLSDQCGVRIGQPEHEINSLTWPWVRGFASLMEHKLSLNRHKGDREGWINDSAESLLERLKEEVYELSKAVYSFETSESIANEAADVANFAMMISDSAGGLNPHDCSNAGWLSPEKKKVLVEALQFMLDSFIKLNGCYPLRYCSPETRYRFEACQKAKQALEAAQ